MELRDVLAAAITLVLFGGALVIQPVYDTLQAADYRNQLAERPDASVIVLPNNVTGCIDVLGRTEQASVGFYRWKYCKDKTSFYFGTDLVDTAYWRVFNGSRQVKYFNSLEPELVVNEDSASKLFSYDYFYDWTKNRKAGTLTRQINLYPNVNDEIVVWEPAENKTKYCENLRWIHETDFAESIDLEQATDGTFTNQKLLKLDWTGSKKQVSSAKIRNGKATFVYKAACGKQVIDPAFGAGSNVNINGTKSYWRVAGVGTVRSDYVLFPNKDFLFEFLNETKFSIPVNITVTLDSASAFVESVKVLRNVNKTVALTNFSHKQLFNASNSSFYNETVSNTSFAFEKIREWVSLPVASSLAEDSANFTFFYPTIGEDLRISLGTSQYGGTVKVGLCAGTKLLNVCVDPVLNASAFNVTSNSDLNLTENGSRNCNPNCARFVDGKIIGGAGNRSNLTGWDTWADGELLNNPAWTLINGSNVAEVINSIAVRIDNGMLNVTTASGASTTNWVSVMRTGNISVPASGIAIKVRVNSTFNTASFSPFICFDVTYDRVVNTTSLRECNMPATAGSKAILMYWEQAVSNYRLQTIDGGGAVTLANFGSSSGLQWEEWTLYVSPTQARGIITRQGGQSSDSGNVAHSITGITSGQVALDVKNGVVQTNTTVLFDNFSISNTTVFGQPINLTPAVLETGIMNDTIVATTVRISNQSSYYAPGSAASFQIFDANHNYSQFTNEGGFNSSISSITGVGGNITFFPPSEVENITASEFTSFLYEWNIPAPPPAPSVVTSPPNATVSISNSTSANSTVSLASEHLFSNVNFSDADNHQEVNSTFKWLKRTLYQPQNRSLVGYWKLDGNGNDSSAYDNRGTMAGGVRSNLSMDCKVDDCLAFDGVDDYVEIANSSSMDIKGQITVEAWVNPSMLRDDRFVISRGSTGTGNGWVIYENTAGQITIRLNTDDGVNPKAATLSNGLVANAWQHIAFTYDGSNLRLYVNGTVRVTTAATGNIIYASNQNVTEIGQHFENPDRRWNGSIDEVAIYNYAKSAADIKADYDNSPYKAMIYKGAAGYWHLDGNANDASGNGNTGTVSGATANVAGIIGTAYSFDGANDFINISVSNNTSPGSLNITGNITFSVWVYINNLNLGSANVFSNGDGYFLEKESGANALSFHINGARATTGTLTFGVWTHLAGTYNGTHIAIYRNGNLDGTQAQTGAIVNDNFGLLIGRRYVGDGTRWFNGKVDELAIYNRSLTASEIKQLYLRTWYDYSPQLFLLQPYKDNATGLNSSDKEKPTSTGGTISNVTGAFSGTQGVNLTQGFLNYSNNNSQNFNEREGTVEFWVKPTWVGNDNLAHSFFNTETTTVFNISKSSGNDFAIDTNGTRIIRSSVSGWTSGDWRHVAVTWNNYTSNIYLFINGTLANNSGTAFTIPAANSFLIGAANAGARDFCNCTISEFRISRKALTAQEINLSFSKSRQFYQNEFMLNSSNFRKGDGLRLEYQPGDSSNATGNKTNSSILYIHNTIPSGAISFPTEGITTSLNMLNATNLSDFDGDSLTCYWYKNGSFISAPAASACNISYTASLGNNVINFSVFDGEIFLANQTVSYNFDNRTNISLNLSLNGLQANRLYEWGTIANISVNSSSSNSQICIDLLVGGFGTNYTCAKGSANLSYDTSHQALDNFDFNLSAVNLTSNGTINVTLDNRTKMKRFAFNISGFSSYPENVTVTAINGSLQAVMPGQLQENGRLYDNSFYSSTNYKTSTNLSFSAAGSQTFFANFSTSGISFNQPVANISFSLSGFNIDAGNSLSLTENFNLTNGTYINHTLSRNSTAPNATWENFERDLSSFGRWKNATPDGNTDLCGIREYVNNAELGGFTNFSCKGSPQGAPQSQKYWTQEFDVRNITKIVIMSQRAESCASTYAVSNDYGFYDGSSFQAFYSKSLTCSGGDKSNLLTYTNVTLIKQPGQNIWNVTAQEGTASPVTSSFTGTLSGNNWYLGFSQVLSSSGNPPISDKVFATLYVMEINVGGFMASRNAANNSNFTTFTSITTLPVAMPNPIIAATLSVTDLTTAYQGASINRTFELSNNNGTNFVKVASGERLVFSTSGNGLVARFNCTSSTPLQSCFIPSYTLSVVPSQISNLSVDVGSDGITESAYTFVLNESNSPQNFSVITTNLISYVRGNCAARLTCRVPISVSSVSGGLLQISNFNRTQYVNPVVLNSTLLDRYSLMNFTINFTGGTIQSYALNVSFEGYYNWTVRANFAGDSSYFFGNVSREIQVHLSNYSFVMPYTFTKDIILLPNSNNSKNVTPFGQTSTTPLYNITGRTLDKGFVLAMRFNETIGCVNVTASNSSSKGNGKIMNASWQDICFVNATGNCKVFAWADYNQCSNSTAFFRPRDEKRSCCFNCTPCW